jgi:hypothetical protein
MIGLPHRANRSVDETSGSCPLLRITCEQVPNSATKICASKNRIEHDRGEHHGDDIRARHGAVLSKWVDSSSRAGPFQVRFASAPSSGHGTKNCNTGKPESEVDDGQPDERIPHPRPSVTASSVRMSPCTIHGWRPTSIVIQPASIAPTAATPDTAITRSIHGLSKNVSRRFRHRQATTATSPTNAVPIETMT